METTEGSQAADKFFEHDLKQGEASYIAQKNLDEDVEQTIADDALAHDEQTETMINSIAESEALNANGETKIAPPKEKPKIIIPVKK